MSFRVTRNSDGTITAESDGTSNDVDHVFAQRHSRELDHYMRDLGQSRIEGKNYDDIVNHVVNERNKKYGYDPAERSMVGLKLVW